MKLRLLKAAISVIFIAGSALGQLNGISGDFADAAKSKFSLFNPEKLKMRQSYSLWYSSSSRGSQSLAMYLNSIEYQISDPLKLQLNLGYLHRPGAVARSGVAALENGKLLPGISLSWKPSENFFLRLNYQQSPVYFNGLYYDDNFSDR